MNETLLTVEQAAERLQLAAGTVRRQINRGDLRAFKRGRQWRVPESALLEESAPNQTTVTNGTNGTNRKARNESARAARRIIAGLESGDTATRNAAIIRLAKSDAATVELVEEAIEAAEAAYDGPQDDLSDWRALDGEPFHFPEEDANYLTGLYREHPKSEKKPQGDAR